MAQNGRGPRSWWAAIAGVLMWVSLTSACTSTPGAEIGGANALDSATAVDTSSSADAADAVDSPPTPDAPDAPDAAETSDAGSPPDALTDAAVAEDAMAEDAAADNTAPDSDTGPDIAPPDAALPDQNAGAETEPSDTQAPDTEAPDAEPPDTEPTDIQPSDAGVDTALTDATQPDATQPDTADTAEPPSGPSLQVLALAGKPLNVKFSPQIHDYAMPCGVGLNTWTVLAKAEPGQTVQILQPPLGPPPGNTAAATIQIAEGAAVVVRAMDTAGQSSDYWIRCLPHDFPQISVQTSAPPVDGYYLLGNTFVAPGNAGYAMILDSHGTPVWFRKTGAGACLVDAMGTNRIGFSPLMGQGFGIQPEASYTVRDLAADTTAAVQTVGMPTDQHELLPSAAGGYLVLSYPLDDAIDLSSRGVTPTTPVADCVIQDLDAAGQVTWQWVASEHLDIAVESTDLAMAQVKGVAVVDPLHCNAVAEDADGNVLLSMRHTDALYLIGRQTGKVLWKLGGTPQTEAGAQVLTLLGDPLGGFFHQHDGRFLANGHLTLFDNHTGQPGAARGLELALDVTAGTATVVFAYVHVAVSQAMGSYRTLWDGSHVLAWGIVPTSVAKPVMTEIDANGTILRELFFVEGDLAYRVSKWPLETFDLDLLRADAGNTLW